MLGRREEVLGHGASRTGSEKVRGGKRKGEKEKRCARGRGVVRGRRMGMFRRTAISPPCFRVLSSFTQGLCVYVYVSMCVRDAYVADTHAQGRCDQVKAYATSL
jgi:hypothetical protein